MKCLSVHQKCTSQKWCLEVHTINSKDFRDKNDFQCWGGTKMIFYPHFLTSKNDQYLTSTPLIIPKSVYITSKTSHGLLIAIFENTKTWIYFQSQKICLYQLQDVLRSSKYLICNGKNVFFGEIYHWYLRVALYHLEIKFGYFLINIQPSNFVEIPLKIITFSPIGWLIFTFFF